MKGDIIEALLGLWRSLPGDQLALFGQTNFDDIRRFNIDLSDACTAARRLVVKLRPPLHCTPQMFSRAVEVANLAFEDLAIRPSWKGARKTQYRREQYSPMLRALFHLA